MTVPAIKIVSGPYVGNDLVAAYAYEWTIQSKEDVAVYETDADGLSTLLTVDVDYTVGGIGDEGGGSITRTAGALPAGYKWLIRSNLQPLQETAFSSQGGFYPDVHEMVFDRLTRLAQQMSDTIVRSLRLAESETGDMVLPVASARKGKVLAFNSATGLPEALSNPINVGEYGGVVAETYAEAAMLTGLTSGQQVHILSRSAPTYGLADPFDGGGGIFAYCAGDYSDEVTADTLGGIYLPLTEDSDGSEGCLVRRFSGALDPAWFGAVADGATDDSSALQAVVNFAYTYGPAIVNLMGRTYAGDIDQKPGVRITNGTLKGQITIGDIAAVNPTDFSGSVIDYVKFRRDALAGGTIGIQVTNAREAGRIDRCSFTNLDIGINVPAIASVHLQNVTKLRITNCEYMNVNHFCDFRKNTTSIYGAADTHIINNTGLAVVRSYFLEGMDGLIFDDNTMFFAYNAEKRENVWLDYCNFAKIINSNFFIPGWECLVVGHFQNTVISGNSFAFSGCHEPKSAVRLHSGTVTGDPQCLSVVSNNTFIHPTLHGVSIEAEVGLVTAGINTIFEAGTEHPYYTGGPIGGNHYAVHDEGGYFNFITGNNCGANAIRNDSTTTIVRNNVENYGQSVDPFRILTLEGTETTVDTTRYECVILSQSGATTVDTIDGGYEGKVLVFKALNANTTIQHTASVVLKGGVNANLPAFSTLTLRYIAGGWIETGRGF